MSGGGESGHDGGILEASPGAIAVLVAFFLVVTLGLEHGLHHLKHALEKRKKKGLLAAVTNLSNELMLLGVASLLLAALEPVATKVCLPAENQMAPWLSNVKDCACCLSRTHGVSHCFMEARQCPADQDQQCGVAAGPHRPFKRHVKYATPTNATAAPGHDGPAVTEGHSLAANASATKATGSKSGTAAVAAVVPAAAEHAAGKRLLAAATPTAATPAATGQADYAYYEEEQPTCDGSVEAYYEVCDYRPGYAPVITEATLEQVHMLLFIMAVTHIIISMLVLVLSTCRLSFWAKAAGGAKEDLLAVQALHLQAPPPPPTEAAAAQFATAGNLASKDCGEAAAATPDVPELPAGSAAAAAAAAQPDVEMAGGSAVVVLPGQLQPPSAAGGAVVSGVAAKEWRGRPEKLQGFAAWARELLQLCGRQLLLCPTVTRQEYAVLRASFYFTHNVGAICEPSSAAEKLHTMATAKQGSFAATPPGDSCCQPDAEKPATGTAAAAAARQPAGLFAPYLNECVERDGAGAVGLGLPMWLLVIAFVLLSGAIGWATWLLLIIAGGMLLLINTALLAAMRYMTRGGSVRQQLVPKKGPFMWLQHPRLLRGTIKLLLFFLAFVVSNAIYFAAFFGPESCFFSRTGFQRNPVPWWAIMLIDLFLLLNLALVTLPLYTLTTHTLSADKKLLQQLQDQKGHDLSASDDREHH